eukprot:Hpha_TRINITY_DN19521_c0_g1::TRINITY_DN19521_c0_g1_i1::g.33563::m.33563
MGNGIILSFDQHVPAGHVEVPLDVCLAQCGCGPLAKAFEEGTWDGRSTMERFKDWRPGGCRGGEGGRDCPDTQGEVWEQRGAAAVASVAAALTIFSVPALGGVTTTAHGTLASEGSTSPLSPGGVRPMLQSTNHHNKGEYDEGGPRPPSRPAPPRPNPRGASQGGSTPPRPALNAAAVPLVASRPLDWKPAPHGPAPGTTTA